jgi:serine/threonine protein kinase
MSATAPPKLPRGAALRVTEEIAVGTVLDGKYRLESVLGRGGMAVVFAATHVTLGHAVAIKVMKHEAGGSSTQAERIVREARAAAGLTSENTTRVLDIGSLDSGEPYIVMERLVGVDLAHLLLERGPLPVKDVASFLVQACEAVAEAHSKDLVHRDLKPSNLFLTTRRDGSPLVKLMDFGISKVVSEAPEESLTATRDSLGTPHYMSPEQLMTSREVDTRTDVWAFGVILYRLLTGEHPFVGETTPAVHIAVASSPAPRLRDKRPDAPQPIEQLVFDCLVKSRAKRLQSVQAFAKVLLAFADEDTARRYAHLAEPPPATRSAHRTPDEVDVELDVGSLAAADTETHSAWGTGRSKASGPERRSKKALGIVSLAVVATAVIGSMRWVGRTSASETAVSATESAVSAVGASPVATANLASKDPPQPSSDGPSAGVSAQSSSSHPVASSPAAPSVPIRRRPKPSSTTPATPPPPKLDPYGQRR